jgi:hypothetical protein
MLELIEIVLEAFAALLRPMSAVIELFLEAMALIFFYPFSEYFRNRKRAQWAASPRRKYLEVGVAAVFLAGMSVAVVKLSIPANSSNPLDSVELRAEKARQGEVLRVKVQFKNTNVPERVLVVKEGGPARIVGTRTATDLVHQTKADVSVLTDATPNSTGRIEK